MVGVLFFLWLVWLLVVEKNLGSFLIPLSRLTSVILTSLSVRLCLLVSNHPRLRTSTSVIDLLMNFDINCLKTSESQLIELLIYETPPGQNPRVGVKELKMDVLRVVQEDTSGLFLGVDETISLLISVVKLCVVPKR